MLNFPTGATIEGCSIARIKQIAASIETNSSRWTPIALRGSSPSQCDNAIIAEVALAIGLFDTKTLEPTPLGIAIIGSKSRPKMPRAKADALLADVLAMVLAYNAHPDRIDNVEQVWLYGSYVRGAATVGDLDIALTMSRRTDVTSDDITDRVETLFSKFFPGSSASMHFQKRAKVRTRLFMPERRSTRLSLFFHTDILIQSAEPCSLHYDRNLGIIADPVTLAKHPKATSRTSDMLDRSTVPSPEAILELIAPLQPMHAHWTTGGAIEWDHMSLRSFTNTPPFAQVVNRLVSDQRMNRAVSYNVHTGPIPDFDPYSKAANADKLGTSIAQTCNGVSFCVLTSASGDLSLRRTINEIPGEPITLRASILPVYFLQLSEEHRPFYNLNKSDMLVLSTILAQILAGDLQMVKKRRPDAGKPHLIIEGDLDLEDLLLETDDLIRKIEQMN